MILRGSRKYGRASAVALALVTILVFCGCSAVRPVATPFLEHFPPQKNITGFATSGYIPRALVILPYTQQGLDYNIQDAILSLNDPLYPVNSSGVAIFHDPVSGKNGFNPVQIAQYGLAALAAYDRTGISEYKTRAIANADKLLQLSVTRNGALWQPYNLKYTYYDVTLVAPWWSGMAQGQALSLFVRLAQIDPDPKWMTSATQTFDSFNATRQPGKPWASLIDSDNHLWFEEYAGDVPPLKVLNGDIFAIFGIYDYYMATDSSRARDLFDGGATTVIKTIASFRVKGGVSYYCARVDYCHSKKWQNPLYQGIHVQELALLGQMTGDNDFTSWSNLLASDFVLKQP